MNVRLLIEYDGTEYAGWQKQPTKPTIQALLEDAVSRIRGEKTLVYGAGRTDSGVHALGQVATFFSDDKIKAPEWKNILNFHLPKSIRILEAEEVPMTFSPLKHAVGKVYEYRICNRTTASALHPNSWHIARKLDWKKIRQAAKHFVGTHDFKSFQGARASVKTTVRTIEKVSITDQGGGFYTIRIHANGFLKQMVRAIVGTLVAVGEGKIDPEDISRRIQAADRTAGGPTAPAHGLFLVRVIYPQWIH